STVDSDSPGTDNSTSRGAVFTLIRPLTRDSEWVVTESSQTRSCSALAASLDANGLFHVIVCPLAPVPVTATSTTSSGLVSAIVAGSSRFTVACEADCARRKPEGSASGKLIDELSALDAELP